ncbi:MAG: lipoate--protein ligase family protein [Acidobacteria bacterium]|nr:lipoate--protein ligase family protein [Acidobacteriota bacterium]
MARDHWLLEQVEQGAIDRPVLRVYGWDVPTLSLGYHQRADRAVDRDLAAEMGVAIVRRPTGGRAVLHDREVTYSVVAPTRGEFTDRISDNYGVIADALAVFSRSLSGGISIAPPNGSETVRPSGALPCFASISNSEIAEGNRKMIGSSQKLGRGGFLQHGSIPVYNHSLELQRLTRSPLDLSRFMVTVEDICRLRGASIPSTEVLADRLIAAFEQTFTVHFQRLELTGKDRLDALEIQYASDSWTFRK